MSLTLHLDLAAWRRHLDDVAAQTPGLVPVAKGNGYGFGLGRLAREARRLGSDVLAVGTADEVARVREGFDGEPGWEGDVVVLTPWDLHDPLATELLSDDRVVTTVASLETLLRVAHHNPQARVLIEVQTAMRRFGLLPEELGRAVAQLGDLSFEGWTIHLPLDSDTGEETTTLARAAVAARPGPLWLSHVTAQTATQLASQLGVEARLRLGTKLWLGGQGTHRVTARVLAMHPVRRGERVGYHQHKAPADGWVVVVSGGTANGVALTAPSSASSLRGRAQTLAVGTLDAMGRALSPYTLAGRKRSFVEPPHMQSSLVFVPGAGSVAVGDEVPVEVRLTTVVVDRVDEHLGLPFSR